MLCGPGAIANAIMLMEDASTISLKITLIASIALIYTLTYFILRFSTKLDRMLGETGNNVMMRLMGLILMVIAVECFVAGLRPILSEIISNGNLQALRECCMINGIVSTFRYYPCRPNRSNPFLSDQQNATVYNQARNRALHPGRTDTPCNGGGLPVGRDRYARRYRQ